MDHLILPVVNGSLPLAPLGCIVIVLDVHPGVVVKITYGELLELFCKELVVLGNHGIVHAIDDTCALIG